MSIHTTESFASVRALDSMNAESALRERTFAMLVSEFRSAAARADADAIASFAGTCTDYKNPQPGGGYGKRLQTVGEVVSDAMEYGFTHRAMQVLLNAAAGRASQRDAQVLLDELAATWAEQNTDAFL